MIQNDPLIQLLLRAEKCPQLLLYRKSLLALHNQIEGYHYALSVCPECVSLQPWYDQFVQYLKSKYAPTYSNIGLLHIAQLRGLDDQQGVDFFFEELNAFLQDCEHYSYEQPDCPLVPGEVRAFRIGKGAISRYAMDALQERMFSFFSLKKEPLSEDVCFLCELLPDETILCAAFKNGTDLMQVRTRLEALAPQDMYSDRITYDTLFATTNTGEYQDWRVVP